MRVDEPNHYGTIRQGSFSNVVKQGGGMTGDLISDMDKTEISTETNPCADFKEPFYLCLKCGPFNRVIIEHWIVGEDGPISLDLIHHINYKPRMVDQIYLRKSKSDGQLVSYIYCAECNRVLETSPEQHPGWGQEHYDKS